MRELLISEIMMVAGGKNASKPTKAELEKECRDDMNMGAGFGFAFGAAASKGNPVITLASSLYGMAVAVVASPECQELSKQSKDNKTGDDYNATKK